MTAFQSNASFVEKRKSQKLHSQIFLNKRSELVSKYWHENKFLQHGLSHHNDSN